MAEYNEHDAPGSRNESTGGYHSGSSGRNRSSDDDVRAAGGLTAQDMLGASSFDDDLGRNPGERRYGSDDMANLGDMSVVWGDNKGGLLSSDVLGVASMLVPGLAPIVRGYQMAKLGYGMLTAPKKTARGYLGNMLDAGANMAAPGSARFLGKIMGAEHGTLGKDVAVGVNQLNQGGQSSGVNRSSGGRPVGGSAENSPGMQSFDPQAWEQLSMLLNGGGSQSYDGSSGRVLQYRGGR